MQKLLNWSSSSFSYLCSYVCGKIEYHRYFKMLFESNLHLIPYKMILKYPFSAIKKGIYHMSAILLDLPTLFLTGARKIIQKSYFVFLESMDQEYWFICEKNTHNTLQKFVWGYLAPLLILDSFILKNNTILASNILLWSGIFFT